MARWSLHTSARMGRKVIRRRCDVTVTYDLTPDNGLQEIDYRAVTHRIGRRCINLTNHSFFNLAGEGAGGVEGHELMVNAAAAYTPVEVRRRSPRERSPG